MKAGISVKPKKTSFPNELEMLMNSLRKVPIVEECDWVTDRDTGFMVSVKFADSRMIFIEAIVLKQAYPARIVKTVNDLNIRVCEPADQSDEYIYYIIMAPFISPEAAKQCEKLSVGYMDMSGNYRLHVHWLYMSEQGHPNQHIQVNGPKDIFNPKSKVSSIILRALMRDVSKQWKLSLLSEKLQCSIGQVFKVKNYLCEQLWADMTSEGLRILDTAAIMHAWSAAYSNKETEDAVLDCYTVDSLPVFEKKAQDVRLKLGINSYLTGIAGGVRYVPVVRYNKVHLIVPWKDVKDFMLAAGCDEVDSGSNVQIHLVSSDELMYDARELDGYMVASPVQIYLDSMALKGRGEEVANAILKQEINK